VKAPNIAEIVLADPETINASMSRLRREVTATGGGLPGRPFRPLNAPNPDGPNRESRRRAKRGAL
jgi:hypothetical protein